MFKMAITKEKKQDLIKQYVQDLQEAKNLILIKESALPVSKSTDVRKEIRWQEWKFNVIRKKLFLRALKEAWYSEINLDQMPWAAVAVYANGDEFGPMKTINKYVKEFKKDKEWKAEFEFLGWWFDKEWKDWVYVTELANTPSKEESLSKLVRLLNYPVQHFVAALDQVAKKK